MQKEQMTDRIIREFQMKFGIVDEGAIVDDYEKQQEMQSDMMAESSGMDMSMQM